MTKVSVIITTYNRPDYLPLAIQSVVNQTHKDLEIIVVDDYDNCKEEVKNIIESFADPRIKFVYKDQNEGLGMARNTGLEHATGKYAIFLDDDDKFYKFHIQTLVEALEENNWQIAYTDAVCHVMQKDSEGNYQTTNRVIVYSMDYDSDTLLYQNITPVLTVMFELNDITRNIKLERARVYEDWLFWLELTKHYDMHHLAIPTCMYTFRHDGSSMSSSRNEFTTLLPGIFEKTWVRAKDQYRVCSAMNQILKARGLNEMFRFQ